MAYKANISFSGKISMIKGEVREIIDQEVAKDLVRAGYVTDLSEKQKATATAKASKKSKAGDSDDE